MIAAIFCLAVMLVLQVVTPYWWWVMAVPFLYGLLAARSGWKATWTGGISAGLLWLGSSLIFYLEGSQIIAGRIANMLGVGRPWLMLILSPLLAAIAAGFSGYAGFALKSLISHRRR